MINSLCNVFKFLDNSHSRFENAMVLCDF